MEDDEVYNYLTFTSGGKCKFCGNDDVIKISLTDFAKSVLIIIPNVADEMYVCGKCKRFQFSENGTKRNTIHRF